MKFKSEFNDPLSVQTFSKAITLLANQPANQSWNIMEVCGGQTHSIMKYGLQQILPSSIQLLHGPGCPVCVTPAEYIDKAIALALNPNIIFCTFGDMMRVRGTDSDLMSAKAQGADVRIVYSVLDALTLCKSHLQKEIVFFAIGFETTAPANALALIQAQQDEINNFSLLVSHVLVPPAIETILSAKDNQVQGFLAAGHVCTVMGFQQYEVLSQKYKVPIVVTGFEPLDIMQGIYMLSQQLQQGQAKVENQYTRCVTRNGNLQAQKFVKQVFQEVDQYWRGLGSIAQSGLKIKTEYQIYDAENKFGKVNFAAPHSQPKQQCRIGEVLTGQLKPSQCPLFGSVCNPDNPLGATMVSSEGACAAYFRYRGPQ